MRTASTEGRRHAASRPAPAAPRSLQGRPRAHPCRVANRWSWRNTLLRRRPASAPQPQVTAPRPHALDRRPWRRIASRVRPTVLASAGVERTEMGALENFVQNVNAGDWAAATDQLNGSPMYDILPFLAALNSNSAIAATNISGILRNRGWLGSAHRIEWAGEIVRTRRIPTPPQGLPDDQVTDAEKFLARLTGKKVVGHPFVIDMTSPFRSGWTGGLGGPNSGGHRAPNWYIQYGMDLGVAEGTDVLATFTGHVTKFQPHHPASDSSKVYGAQLFMRSDNDRMDGFYTHFTGGPTFRVGQKISRGDRLGKTLRNHLHLALVEIIGGAPGGRYAGVDLYRDFLAIRDTASTMTVTFKQDGSAPVAV